MTFEKGSSYCCIYGIAEPVEEGFRVYPHPPWQYEGDAWLYVEGLRVEGPVVVGLTYDSEADVWGFTDVSYDPSPDRGQWRSVDRSPRRVWWRPVVRRSMWDLLASDS